MKSDQNQTDLINEATNRPLEALSRLRLPYLRRSPSASQQTQPRPQVEVELSKGATYEKLYNRYAQGVEASSPVNKTLKVARNAARDGHSAEVIVNILRNDPKVQQLGKESEKFLQTVSAAATRKTVAEKYAQQHRQKTPTLER